MTLPLLLSAWRTGPALLKFGIVALATLLGSFGLSKYVVKPYPQWVVVGLIGLNFALAVAT